MEAIMIKSEYIVKGMHCVGCSRAIKKLLEKNKHIKEVNVELYESKIVITYDENYVDQKVIVDTVSRFGYQAIETQS
jgi:copper chaperone CopZ